MARHHVHELREFMLAVLQRSFRLLLLLDVDHRPVPAEHPPVAVARSRPERPEPAVGTVPASQPVLCVVVHPRPQGLPTPVENPLVVVGMQGAPPHGAVHGRSEEHTSELQSLMRISYAVLCLKNTTRYKLPR